MPSIELRPMTLAFAEAVRRGHVPSGVQLAEDYPTEFSMGVAEQALAGCNFGPFCVIATDEGMIVGEIGAALSDAGLEIGYAIVRSRWGRGYATAAVVALLAEARQRYGAIRVVAHAPVGRPASSRVLEKAGFQQVGEVDEEHEGQRLRAVRWERRLSADS